MTERAITARELNRAMLARQHLLERAPASTPLPRLLERVGMLQAQYAPSMYVGLWSRLEGFARDDLTRALERRRVVQATLMRATIHLAAPGDFWPVAVAVREARRTRWLRSRRGAFDAAEMAAAAARMRAELEERPLRRTEVDELVGRERTEGVALWLDLVRVPPSGTWERRRADLLGLAEGWLAAPPDGLTAEDGVDLLVRRYLRAFGPAPRGDIANWAGLPVTVVGQAIARAGDLRRLRGPGGEELVDVRRGPLPDADTPAPVRFLPTWDATLLGHARRAGVLPEEYRTRVFSSRNPHSMATFLVDGVVAGAWRFTDGHITMEPFGRLDAATRRALRDEGDRLAALHA